MLVVSGVSHNDELSLLGTKPVNSSQSSQGMQGCLTHHEAAFPNLEEVFPNLSYLFEAAHADHSEGESSYGHPDQLQHSNLPTDELAFDYVESSQNFQGNYNNYVYRTLKSILPLRSLDYLQILEEKKVLLHPQENRKTIILDLDETLIHADFDNNFPNPDHVLTFNYDDSEVSVPIFIRPGLFEFLHSISQQFEIFIFTASIKEYADTVLNYLDPENIFFKNRFYRNNCICVKNKVFIKDLRIFQNRSQDNLIMVDNSLYSFTNQISNGVLINSFYNDKDDRELFNVLTYLRNYLKNTPDVRIVNEKVFNFNSMIDQFVKECSM